MSKYKYLFIVVLLVGLLATSAGCAIFNRESSSTDASGKPIDNPDWQPQYVDDAVHDPIGISELVDKVAPTVVSIVMEKLTYDTFLRPVPESGAGSGVIIDPKGYIVTNNHVVKDARSLSVVLSDGRSFDAVAWVGDAATDLAVVQIQPGEDLPYAHFLSNSLSKLEKLEDVVAVGNALALSGGPTWTKGVVSYLGRSIQESTGAVLDDLIQTDAAINPGNSGGPLVNMGGQVVGINTAMASGAENIGFAISTDTAIPVIEALVTKGLVVSAWLGVRMLTVTESVKSQYGLSVDSGALIVEVVSGSPADDAGLKANDVIVKFGDTDIKDINQLRAAIQSHSPGDKVTITYVRGQDTATTEATLVQRPSS